MTKTKTSGFCNLKNSLITGTTKPSRLKLVSYFGLYAEMYFDNAVVFEDQNLICFKNENESLCLENLTEVKEVKSRNSNEQIFDLCFYGDARKDIKMRLYIRN